MLLAVCDVRLLLTKQTVLFHHISIWVKMRERHAICEVFPLIVWVTCVIVSPMIIEETVQKWRSQLVSVFVRALVDCWGHVLKIGDITIRSMFVHLYALLDTR